MIVDDARAAAAEIITSTLQNNPAPNMPPWLAGLLLGKLAVDALLAILVELRIANKGRKRTPTDGE